MPRASLKSRDGALNEFDRLIWGQRNSPGTSSVCGLVTVLEIELPLSLLT
jgi:hypothetical protein